MSRLPQMGTTEIGRKSFLDEDQRLFATISMDVNPLHMDPIAARRFATGKQAVHGIHVALIAIELWRNEHQMPPTSLSCRFVNLIRVGDEVVFNQESRGPNESVIEAKVNGLLCLRIDLSSAMRPASQADAEKCAVGDHVTMVDHLMSPLDTPPNDHLGRTYAVSIREEDYSVHFPQSYRYFGAKAFTALCSLSYIVGMVCPGLHSIFTSFDLRFRDDFEGDNLLRFRCEDYDSRFGLFHLSVCGRVEARIRAFWRPSLPKGPSIAELATFVDSSEFEGTKSLVIGGSRGLGSITAKLLAAGGGNVVITYASGFEQAVEICDEINNWRQGACDIAKFDVSTDSFESMNIRFSALHSVYYYPTPRIFTKKAAVFDAQIFLEFYLFYITKFHELCAYLEETSAQPIKIFYPSSMAVEERPRDVTEYAMAKSAAEILIADINRYFQHVSVISVRLPRLDTDQTATIAKNVRTESNVATLLPIIRAINSQIGGK
jgi:hypothetical protein